MTQCACVAASAEHRPVTALVQATGELTKLAVAHETQPCRIQSVEQSSVLITARDQITPDFVGRVVGPKHHVRAQELLQVTATMIVDSD